MKDPLCYLVSAYLLSALFFVISCTKNSERVFSGTVFSAPYEIRIVGDRKKISNDTAKKLIADLFSQAESVLSQENDSELARFNKSERLTWSPASRGLVTVVEEGLRISKLTNGAWDFTGGKLTALYRSSSSKGPGPAAIAAAKAKVGYYYVEVRRDPLALKKSRHGLIVDLQALAPGYAVDEVAEALRRLGVENFQVRVGACVRASGHNAAGEIWPYKYQRPVAVANAPQHLTQELIELSNRAAANVAIPDGTESSHLLTLPLVDPRSGKLLQTDLLNVTALDLSALRAAATGVGLITLGKAEALRLAQKEGLGAYFVSQEEEKGLAEATPLFPAPLHR